MADLPPALPASSVRYIMRRTLGADQDAVTSEAADAVQQCTAEFLSFVASEARARARKEQRAAVTPVDILTTLNALGFKCALIIVG